MTSKRSASSIVTRSPVVPHGTSSFTLPFTCRSTSARKRSSSIEPLRRKGVTNAVAHPRSQSTLIVINRTVSQTILARCPSAQSNSRVEPKGPHRQTTRGFDQLTQNSEPHLLVKADILRLCRLKVNRCAVRPCPIHHGFQKQPAVSLALKCGIDPEHHRVPMRFRSITLVIFLGEIKGREKSVESVLAHHSGKLREPAFDHPFGGYLRFAGF